MKKDALERENTELRQVLSIIAASFPTKLIMGKTGDRVADVCRKVINGLPLFD